MFSCCWNATEASQALDSRSAASVETAPAETGPAEKAPAEISLAETAPAEKATAEKAPAEMALAETAPAEKATAETAPAETAPAETAPAEMTPVETAPVETADPAAAKPRKPDLAGKWECKNIENLDAYLTVMGVGFLQRKAAVAMLSKATLKAEFQVEGDGERFTIINTTPKGVNTLEFMTNGVEFSAKFGPEQTPGTGKSVWDGDTLVLTIDQPGLVSVITRTPMEGKMIERCKATKGGKEATVIRTWVKES